MWFKYFNKLSWETRTFRGANLFYKADDFGMTSIRFNSSWQDYVYKAFRGEAPLRQFVFWVGFGFVPAMIAVTSSEPDLEAIEANKQRELGIRILTFRAAEGGGKDSLEE